MQTLTTTEIKSLEDKIFEIIWASPYIDETDGEVMERNGGNGGMPR